MNRLSAGSAGDWFGHGEERNGAQTCNHSAEGESLFIVLCVKQVQNATVQTIPYSLLVLLTVKSCFKHGVLTDFYN